MFKKLKNLAVFVFFALLSTVPFNVGADTLESDSLVDQQQIHSDSPETVITEGESYFAESKEEITTIYFFDDRLCPVCQDAKEFISSIIDDYPNFEFQIQSITDTSSIREVANQAGVEDYRIMSPMIFIGNRLLQFNNFGPAQEEVIVRTLEGESVDLDGDRYTFAVPFTQREITVDGWSLPVVTIVLGSLDGFNVCSLGALILILSLVMALNSRKLIFLYGGLFILTAVIIYGILVFVWGQLFEAFLGHLAIFRYIVGIAAGAGAIYFFKEFWRFYRFGPTCQTSESALAQKATSRILKVFKDPTSKPVALVGSIVFFAAVITIVELPCSIGVPIAFTGIVIERGVSLGAYTGYILLYLFFYMLIEMIIFTGAVVSKKLWFANSKMVTWVTFAGALVLAYLSLYYLIG